MMRKIAPLVLFLSAVLSFVALEPRGTWKALAADRAAGKRVVYVAGGLADEDLIAVTSCLAAGPTTSVPVLLLDTPGTTKANQAFLAAFQPERVVPVGSFPDGVADLERRLGRSLAPAVPYKRGPPLTLWKDLLGGAKTVVACPVEPRPLLLQAACLAGSLGAPLFAVRSPTALAKDEADSLGQWLRDVPAREVIAVGPATGAITDFLKSSGFSEIKLTRLADEKAVAAAHLRQLRQAGRVRALVVTNPADTVKGLGQMSLLAPWIALQKRAALLFTGPKGDDTTPVVRAALAEPALEQADILLLVGGLKALLTEQRPNPVPGKDVTIEMEPLTPSGNEPFTFATGRLFSEDLGVVPLILARHRLLEDGKPATPRRALVVSNPGGGLPLLETFTRHTVHELSNAGYQTTALFGESVKKEDVRRLLPSADVFLWEGHYRTLIDDFGFLTWNEPLPPTLAFLQSCLALNEGETSPLFKRGAFAIVGSSTRIYSATGGAFTLAFFDALLYDDQSLGGALRQGKNFLLAYSLLKEKRLGAAAKLGGANVRSAWAFTLWGDPTQQLPQPKLPAENSALEPIHHTVKGNTITISLPEAAYSKVVVEKYQAEMLPNARLAGLLTTSGEGMGSRHLVPFVFAEVHLPQAAGRTPTLTSTLSEKSWVFCWDARRRCGYLLLTPRKKDQKEIRFRVKWS